MADNCDTDVQLDYTEVRTDGSCEDAYVLTRTWTATDDCLNVSTCVQVITVRDQTAPVLTGCPADLTIECSDPLPDKGGNDCQGEDVKALECRGRGGEGESRVRSRYVA